MIGRLMQLPVVALLFSAGAGFADTAIQSAKELSEIASELSLEVERLKLLQKQLEVATVRKSIAELLRDAAKSAVEAEQAKRILGVPSIVVDDAWVEVARDPAKFCKADNFLRFQCHRKMECDFLADKKLCALPAGETEPMVLKVTFACGTDIRRAVVPINQQAYLTCK